MAQWIQTLEPYIKVTERVKTTVQNPTAGESLIVGCTLISDAGPSTPTLISSQKEFLETYASRDLSQEYIESLNRLYTGDDKTLASTMWANAYRLAGSCTMLVTRAAKAPDIMFAKPLAKNAEEVYILRDGELMKSVASFKIVIDKPGDEAAHNQDGWNINISGVGIFGNRTTDTGAQYDYYVDNLPDLVEKLNETSKFFSPSYHFYSDVKGENEVKITDPDDVASKNKVVSVIFDEVYLGQAMLDKTDSRTSLGGSWEECDTPEDILQIKKWFSSFEELVKSDIPEDGTIYAVGNKVTLEVEQCYKYTVPNNLGMLYLITCEPDWTLDNPDQSIIDLNDSSYSGFIPTDYYATNVYNSASTLRVRIRRFNHDAVINKEITDKASLTEKSDSPYMVLTSILDTFTGKGAHEPSEDILARDFYEIAIFDPSINGETSFFNVGSITGRGDMEVSEVNANLKMIQLHLPDNLHDLGINYYGYKADDNIWVECPAPSTESDVEEVTTYEELLRITDVPVGRTIYKVTTTGKYYKFVANGENQIWADLEINPENTKLISVSDSDLKKGLDAIVEDEVYVTEGLCDLGNTELSFQNYMANIAINDNYFYPISTVNSTNYMTIANNMSKISKDSYKLYASGPWDIDSGNLGWKYYASPSVLYWEAVARNRRNNREFASILGQVNGIVQYQRPTFEATKKVRQLLLSKKVNFVLWNITTQAWNMNDCYTKTSENSVLSEDGNSRLVIRISKAMPSLLKQFIGRKISEKLCADVEGVINYFFKTVILPMEYTVDAYRVSCVFDAELARQNKIKVLVQARCSRSLKFIDVFSDIYDVGMEFEEA